MATRCSSTVWRSFSANHSNSGLLLLSDLQRTSSSTFLGLTEAEEMAILGTNPHSVSAQKIAMLRKWKQKKGSAATYTPVVSSI